MSKYGAFSSPYFPVPYFPVFSPNTGKYGPEKPPYLDNFYAVIIHFDHISPLWVEYQYHLTFIINICIEKILVKIIFSPCLDITSCSICILQHDTEAYSEAFPHCKAAWGSFPKLRNKCPYSELFWSAFSCIRIEYGEIRSISPYSVQMWEKADKNNSEYGHFWPSANFACGIKWINFYSPWNPQKTVFFLTFSGWIEVNQIA